MKFITIDNLKVMMHSMVTLINTKANKDYVDTKADKKYVEDQIAARPIVNPDWNQDDSSEPDYIKNHPGIRKGTGNNAEVFNSITPEKATGKNSHIEGDQSYLKEYKNVVISNVNAVEQTYEVSIDINKDVFPHIMQFYQNGDLKFAFITKSYDNSAGFVVTSYSDISTLAPGTYNIKLISGLATGDRSHVEGNNNIANARESHVEGWNNMATGWVDGNGKKIGDGVAAHAEGREARAIGRASHAEGRLTKAIGAHSHAEGFTASAMGDSSHAEGNYTTASGEASHAEGDYTTASGDYSHAEGDYTTASGDYSHAEGRETTASGDYSHAEGSGRTTASGDSSHAEGDYTTASGGASHAEGNWTTASGYCSHAEGGYTTASVVYSHAEGNGTTASGAGSHAEGRETTASGGYSHVEGHWTTASGGYSHAEGENTRASGAIQHVQGRYNIEDPSSKYVHIVGNGIVGNGTPKPSNAHTLDWDGNSWYQGSVLVAGKDMDAPDAELRSDSVIIKSSTPGSVKRFKITVTDDGVIKATAI